MNGVYVPSSTIEWDAGDLIAMLDATGQAKVAMPLAAESIARDLRKFEQLAADFAAPPRPLKRENRICISGFFYSGSSAVLDYLLQDSNCKRWAPFGEMRVVRTPGGLYSFGKKYYRNEKASTKTAALINLFLCIEGHKYLPKKHPDLHPWEAAGKIQRKLKNDPRSVVYERSIYGLMKTLFTEPPETRKEFEGTTRAALLQALDGAAQGYDAKHLLMDQVINAWRLYLGKLMPPSTFIVVDRDPRDQYVEACAALTRWGRSPPKVEKWIEQHKKRRATFKRDSAAMEAEYGHRFIKLRFEDFVMDHAAVGRSLREHLGIAEPLPSELLMEAPPPLEPGAKAPPGTFNPFQSRRNVGKYKTELAAEPRRAIEKELADYLYPKGDSSHLLPPADVDTATPASTTRAGKSLLSKLFG